MTTIKQMISANLWFDDQAEEAARFYTSIFKNSKIGRMAYYGKEGYEIHRQPAGKVLIVEFEIEGQTYLAMNGGPQFKFNEAISFIVNCETQEEIDYYWEKLSEQGDLKAQRCGWLKDKYGVSWQVVPVVMTDMICDPDPEIAGRVMNVMLTMKKLDIKSLENAYKG